MKKKAEFSVMKNDVVHLQEENKNLKEKVCIFKFYLIDRHVDQ